jgi:ABC-2 type transport system ATP-binding protein
MWRASRRVVAAGISPGGPPFFTICIVNETIRKTDDIVQTMIQVQGLEKRYGRRKRPAVAGFDLQVEQGQLFGLIGPDGAGKTTVMRMLSTVIESSAGEGVIAGFDLQKDVEQVRRNIGYMPQQFSLYPDLSVMENLVFFADLNQVPAAEKRQRIKNMLAFTNLADFERRAAHQLSGGMKKKLALACALIHDPDVLLLDEPSTGVDPVSRRELWVILAEVVQRGVACVVTTPYMDEADRCHRVGILYEGHMIAAGTPASLKAKLPYAVIEVKAKPRKTMRTIVADIDDVIRWRPVGDRIRMLVEDDDRVVRRVMKRLESALKREECDLRLLRRDKVSMEDVFVHEVRLLNDRGGKDE